MELMVYNAVTFVGAVEQLKALLLVWSLQDSLQSGLTILNLLGQLNEGTVSRGQCSLIFTACIPHTAHPSHALSFMPTGFSFPTCIL